MSKRPRNRDQGMFDNLQDAPSLEDSNNAIFGVSPFPVTPTVKVKFIDIASIYPDPAQPRRAIPSELRSRWNIHDHTYEDLIAVWFTYMGPEFDLDAYLLDGNTERSQLDPDNQPLLPEFEPEDAVQAGFIHLLELASSILREGLTNPITISRVGRDYMIETGERRWLAYHLLNVYFEDSGDQDWSKIPARVMPERNVWRQATENNVRQNLNAVSRARQLAILVMDIHGWDNFRLISDFADEQEFYAQVSEGREWQIPSDKIEQLLKSMGLNNQTQLRQYRAILRTHPMLWQVADDNNWSENKIREAHRRGPDAWNDKLKNVAGITSITRGKKINSLDRAINQTHKQRTKISKQAERSKQGERLEWREFAQEQALWWDKLAQKLSNES
jgi:ParB-like chromosome segregation protein Spo0J